MAPKILAFLNFSHLLRNLRMVFRVSPRARTHAVARLRRLVRKTLRPHRDMPGPEMQPSHRGDLFVLLLAVISSFL
jgi:hypothetical protein